MEKASTPRNRLTRSAAKQVNSPSNSVDQDDQTSNEDTKQSVRRTRRKTITKMKTNGDALTCSPQTPNNAAENKRLKSSEEISDGNSFDGYDSENSNVSAKLRNSPKLSNHKTPPPAGSTRTLRTRRSITPGPELESSASKRMKRSTSEGKVDTLGTPTNRRGMRAKSESKDFKPKSSNFEKLCSDSGNRYVNKNSTLRVIDKIVEANEADDSSLDDEPLKNLIDGAKSQKVHIKQDESNEKFPEVVSNPKLEHHDSTLTEVINTETHNEIGVCTTGLKDSNSENGVEKEENQEQVGCQETKPYISEIKSGRNPEEEEVLETKILETSAIVLQVDSEGNENIVEDKLSISTSFSESIVESTVKNAETSSKRETENQDTYKENKVHAVNEEENEKCDSDSIEIDVIAVDSNSFEAPLKPSMEAKNCHNQSNILEVSTESLVVTQTDNDASLTENNNINPIPMQLENDGLDEQNDEVISDCSKVNISLKSNTPVKDEQTKDHSISSNSDINTCHQKNDNSDDILELQDNNETDDNKDNGVDMISSINLENEEQIEAKTECSEELEKEHQQKNPFESHETQSQQCNDDISDAVLIEESEDSPANENSENQDCFEVEEIDESESCNIEIETDKSKSIGFIQSDISENPELHPQNLLEQNQFVCGKINEGDKQIIEEYNEDEIAEVIDDSIVIKETEEDEMLVLESSINVDQNNEHQLDINYKDCEEDNNYDNGSNHDEDRISNRERNYDNGQSHDEDEDDEEHKKYKEDSNFDEDNYNNGTSNKIEESASDSDIYKDMSDFGSDGDEQKDGSQFNSASSEFGSGDSEEYKSSVEEEELEEEDENNENQGNQECFNSDDKNEQCERKDTLSHNMGKDGEKLFDNDNPITYDKALAILNKNRVKKIDDEEFFDMFTEELNKVSGKSDSDSDIAIVDEYIMEPEESSSKPSKNPGNSQGNSKPIQRPTNPVSSQVAPPPGPFYNQQGPPRITLINMQRMNFPNPNYRPHNQNFPLRGHIMYNQIPRSNHPMLGMPRMFNPQVPPDVNFPSAVFDHSMQPNTQLGYAREPPLKVRSVNSLNSPHIYNEMDRNYGGLQADASEINTARCAEIRENVRSAATMTEIDENLGKPSSSASRNSGTTSVSTPILDLLALDKQKLKQLKKILGINKQSSFKMTPSVKFNESDQPVLKLKKDSDRKKCKGRKKSKRLLKQSENALKKSLVKQIIDSDSATFTDTRLKRPSNVESSSETSSSSDQRIFMVRSREDVSSSSSSESVSDETANRKVNLAGGQVVSVTFEGAKNQKDRRYRKKRRRNENSSESSSIIPDKRKKFNYNVISDTKLRAENKMTQKKKENAKKTTFVKSNCGTFAVDGVTASSQSSDSEAPSREEQVDSTPEDYYLQELNQVREDAKSGRNKLSNMFSQHRMSKDQRGSKESERENVGRKRKRSRVKKLPTEILDNLSTDEDSVAKRRRSADSGSDEAVTVPRKGRKRGSRTTKVKSGVSGESYVPCVTAGATQFGLSRLDKVTSHTLKAAQFRTDQLYGASVKRITTAELMKTKNKQKFNESTQKKRKRRTARATTLETE